MQWHGTETTAEVYMSLLTSSRMHIPLPTPIDVEASYHGLQASRTTIFASFVPQVWESGIPHTSVLSSTDTGGWLLSSYFGSEVQYKSGVVLPFSVAYHQNLTYISFAMLTAYFYLTVPRTTISTNIILSSIFMLRRHCVACPVLSYTL